MYTGLFTYLAHPDLIHYTGDDLVYRHHVRTMCRAANDCGLPVELNFLGMREGRHYPNIAFWEVAAEEGCRVVFGNDAHDAQAMKDTASFRKAMELVQRLGLERVRDPKIIPIR